MFSLNRLIAIFFHLILGHNDIMILIYIPVDRNLPMGCHPYPLSVLEVDYISVQLGGEGGLLGECYDCD